MFLLLFRRPAKIVRNFGTSTCTIQENLVFLKTHKCAGSSLQNVCMRYASQHGLMVALPPKFNYFGHPAKFHKQFVPHLHKGYNYNILTHHTRFDYRNIKEVMPKNATFFTILREPVSLFESAYDYYYLPSLFNMSLETFVNQTSQKFLDKRVTAGRIGRNQMSFDLGMEVQQFEDEGEIQKFVQNLDKEFNLVMISERMNESLVLLQHLLCWTIDDVVVLHQNARDKTAKKALSSDVKSKILKVNKADKFLYDYFSERFQDRVNEFGVEKMKMEVAKLQLRIEEWYKYCISGINKNDSEFADNIETFVLANTSNKTCEYLSKSEMNFTEELLRKQAKYTYL